MIKYSADRVFETLPEGLRTVRRIDRNALIVIEADADPNRFGLVLHELASAA